MFHDVEQTTTERTAAAVRAELARRKINGSQFAEALGWSRATAWRRLNGTHPFSLDELVTVAAYLAVPVAALIDDTERAA